MDKRGLIEQCGFWAPALLWLPAGLVAFAVLRFRPDPATWESMLLLWARSLTPDAPCGLPLALGCRRLWRLGYRRTTWTAGIGLGAVTVAERALVGFRRLAFERGYGKVAGISWEEAGNYLNTREAAAWLGLSPRTLDRYRVSGEGPHFHRFGYRVRYLLTDMEAWASARRRVSTSDDRSAAGRKTR